MGFLGQRPGSTLNERAVQGGVTSHPGLHRTKEFPNTWDFQG